jgi:hypothetical protein
LLSRTGKDEVEQRWLPGNRDNDRPPAAGRFPAQEENFLL